MHLDIRAGHKTDIATIKCDGYGCNLLDEGYLRTTLTEAFHVLLNKRNTQIQIQKYNNNKYFIATIKCDGYGCNLLDEGYL